MSAPGRCVVALKGDDAFKMLKVEFFTAVAQDINLRVVVIDNAKAGLIQFEQESEGFPEASTGQHNSNYAALAEAFERRGFSIDTPFEHASTLRSFFAHNGPSILGARVNPKELIFPPKVSFEQAWFFGLARAKAVFRTS